MPNITWWNEVELIRDRRFKKINLDEDTWVYRAILTVEEALELSEKYKKNFLSVFEGEPLTEEFQQGRKTKVRELEQKLNDPKTRFVSAWIFEWDY
ncbi:MAG: hypothetical protein ACE5E9_13395 [Nitrospinaceae bacterium]